MDRLMRITEVSGLTALSKETVYGLMSSGQFPRPVIVGPRSVRWRESDLREWLESRPVSDGSFKFGINESRT